MLDAFPWYLAAEGIVQVSPYATSCTDRSGRPILVFNNGTFAATQLSHSRAIQQCSSHGGSLLTQELATLQCVRDYRFNAEQAWNQLTLLTAEMISPIWIQETRGKCFVGNIDGRLSPTNCEKPSHFLCVKRKFCLLALLVCSIYSVSPPTYFDVFSFNCPLSSPAYSWKSSDVSKSTT